MIARLLYGVDVLEGLATLPEAIPEICIKAGTSAGGCCGTCGSPFKRIVKGVSGTSKECPKTQLAHEVRGGIGKVTGTVGKSGSGRINEYSETLGWQPTCQCHAETIPCTVLDPFAGSGTTGKVAVSLGRQFIGIDLQVAYLELAKQRLGLFAV